MGKFEELTACERVEIARIVHMKASGHEDWCPNDALDIS